MNDSELTLVNLIGRIKNAREGRVRLTVLQKYLLRETLLTLLAVLFILLLIMVGGLFAKLLGHVAAGKLTADVLFPLLFFLTLRALPTLLTVALFLGILITLGRFYKDSEMIAINAGGGGFLFLMKPIILITSAVMIILMTLSLWIYPKLQVLTDTMRQQSVQKLDISGITAGQFIHLSESGSMVFAETTDPDEEKTLLQVFLFNITDAGLRVAVADKAKQVETSDNKRVLEMQHGSLFERPASGKGYRLMRYQTQGVLLPEREQKERIRTSGLTTKQLLNSENLEHKAELQSRISVPLVALVLALLAIPLSHTSPRKGQFTKLAGAILIFIVYQNLFTLARSWMIKGLLPSFLGVWWVHLVFLLLFFILLGRQYSYSWILSKLSPG